MYIWQPLRKHLLFDAILILFCLISIAGVWNHGEGDKTYTICGWLYFLSIVIILVRQVLTVFSDNRLLIFTSLFLFFLYLVLGFAGMAVFAVRSFAW